VAGRSGPFTLRDDVIRFPDAVEARYIVLVNPDSAFIVPYFDNADTMLVRQWRHAWNEVVVGGAGRYFRRRRGPCRMRQRELAEETGLIAERYTSLGVVHGARSSRAVPTCSWLNRSPSQTAAQRLTSRTWRCCDFRSKRRWSGA